MDRHITLEEMIEIKKYLYEIPSSYASYMRVSARVYMHPDMMQDIKDDRSLQQLINVASLPGIQKYALAMPDIHQGYGFPIGGVAATAIEEGGVISPGGIGYDINCGVRLLIADIPASEIKPYQEKLATALFHAIPSGVGSSGKLKMSMQEMDLLLQRGAQYMLEREYGIERDLEFCEEKGNMTFAIPHLISKKAKERGLDQLGTLGSGNHFLEVQEVEEIYDQAAAESFGLAVGMVTIMIHCGSRGLGHQVCTDYVKIMTEKLPKWGYSLPDRELVCAPFKSQEGQEYFGAMAAAANYAWANRHTITHWVREAWQRILGKNSHLKLMYDVSHNLGKLEMHQVDGVTKQLVVHRKGATRSFGPHDPSLPAHYQTVGQPVLIPGTMGTSSYILVGTEKSMHDAFGTSCHGAGRRLSRAQAKKTVRGTTLRKQLEDAGIIIRCDSDAGLSEEAPIAYKDVDAVVQVVHDSSLARKVARVRPLAVIKGG